MSATLLSMRCSVAAAIRVRNELAWLLPVLRNIGGPLQRAGEILTWLGTDPVNLLRERDIEWSWIVGKMGNGPGEALDFGNGGSYLSLVAARRGYQVTAVDLLPVDWLYRHPNLRFLMGDIVSLNLPRASFDLIINCSSIEHVGLAGRYGVTEGNPNGDLEAMAVLMDLCKDGGIMLLTTPVGKDTVFRPLHRVYGEERLPRLIEGWEIREEEYWVKDETNHWGRVDRTSALRRQPKREQYGLGLFVLAKP